MLTLTDTGGVGIVRRQSSGNLATCFGRASSVSRSSTERPYNDQSILLSNNPTSVINNPHAPFMNLRNCKFNMVLVICVVLVFMMGHRFVVDMRERMFARIVRGHKFVIEFIFFMVVRNDDKFGIIEKSMFRVCVMYARNNDKFGIVEKSMFHVYVRNDNDVRFNKNVMECMNVDGRIHAKAAVPSSWMRSLPTTVGVRGIASALTSRY